MRITLCLFFILFIGISSIAQFKITAIKGLPGSYSDDHTFPYIRGGNKEAADKINSLLQSDLLINDTAQTHPAKIFENSVFISNDSISQSGITEINYEVVMNNARILSLRFMFETMGAYPEYYVKYYSFLAQTGDPVLAKDIFTNEGIDWLRNNLNNERATRIEKYLKENDYEQEDSIYIRETFTSCKEDPEENSIFIQPMSLRFFKERCFPHARRNIDDDLDIEIPLKSVEKYLSATGKKLLQ